MDIGTPKKGLSREIDDISEIAYSISKNKLKAPIWPEDTINQPKKLRIGVPVRDAFNEFIKVEWCPRSDKDKPKIYGFSIDVFLAMLARVAPGILSKGVNKKHKLYKI